MGEMVAEVHDAELIYSSPAEVKRKLELKFVDECIGAGFSAPDEVVIEAQLGLFGDATVTFRAEIVKPKKRFKEVVGTN